MVKHLVWLLLILACVTLSGAEGRSRTFCLDHADAGEVRALLSTLLPSVQVETQGRRALRAYGNETDLLRVEEMVRALDVELRAFFRVCLVAISERGISTLGLATDKEAQFFVRVSCNGGGLPSLKFLETQGYAKIIEEKQSENGACALSGNISVARVGRALTLESPGKDFQFKLPAKGDATVGFDLGRPSQPFTADIPAKCDHLWLVVESYSDN